MWTSIAVSVVMCMVLSSVSAASVNKPTLQLGQCSWGAQYWCSSPQTADLCGKTEWCTKNDWSHDIIQDFPCTVTQQLIKNTRSLIKDSSSKPVSDFDYALFIAKGCTVFKDDKSRQTCKELASKEDVILKLVKLLDSKLSVQEVSIAVGLCKKDIPKEEQCPRCADVVSTAQKYIGKLFSENAYMKIIDAVCAKLGQGYDICRVIGKDKYKDFYNGLINTPAQSLCEGTTKCFGLTTNFQAMQSSTECEVCTAVVKEIRQLDQSPDVQAVIKNLVKSVCFNLGEFNQMCDDLANEGLQYLFELIATEMEPDVVCEELKMCNQPEQKINQQQALPAGTPVCNLCELVLKVIDTMITSNTTKVDLEKLLNIVCNYLPPPFNSECKGFVEKYAPAIIEMLLKKLDPKLVCTELHFCNNKTSPLVVKLQPKVQSIRDDQLCLMCKFVVSYLDTFLEKNTTQAQIEDLLGKVCAELPGNWSAQCNALVKDYTPLFVEVFLAEMQPDKVCTYLKLCTANKQAAMQIKVQPKVQKKPNVDLCALCKYVVTYLDSFLDEKATMADIEALLNKVCTKLPGNWTAECETLVQLYGPWIVRLLEAELQPDKVCTVIGLCTGNKQAASQFKLQPIIVQKPNDQLCDLCKYVVTYFDTFLGENSTEAEIEALLDKVCTILPGNWTAKCETLVKQYGPLIIMLLKAELKPDKVCTAIGLCTGNKQAVSEIKLQPKILKKPNDLPCEVCKSVMTYLDKYLEKNSTVAEIEALLGKVCAILPRNLKAECESLVKQYGPLIIQLLEAEIQPDKVCTEIGLCTGNKQAVSEVKLQPKILKKPNDLPCDLCKSVITFLDTYLEKNSTVAEIEALLGKVCAILPGNLKAECESLVKQYGPLIIQLLEAEMQPDKVCTEIGLCTGNKQVAPQVKFQPKILSPPNDAQCELCKYVVTYLDTYLDKNATEAQVEALLEKLCAILPESLRQQCNDFVKKYGPIIVQMLKEELQPDKVCTELGLCTGIKQVPLSQTPVKKGELCPLCQLVFTELYKILEKNSTKQQVEAALGKICGLLPPTIKDECLTFVDTYLPYVVDLILQELTPDQICQKLGVCTSAMNQAKIQALVAIQKTGSGPECVVCEYVVQYLDNILGKNATEQQIEAALKKVCNVIPPALKTECDSFITKYTPELVQFLKTLTPQQVCSAMKLCTSQGKVPLSQTPVKKGELCPLCQLVFTELYKILEKNSTKQQVEAALDKICGLLPPTIKDECLSFVDTYLPYVVDLILQELSPDQICQKLGVCTTAVNQVPLSQTPVKKGELCPLCQLVFTELYKILEKNSTKQQVEAALDKICGLLPPTIKDECLSFVDTYLPYVVDLILQELSPDQICQKLGVCTTAVNQVPLSQTPVKKGELCPLCQLVFTELYKILEKNSTKQQVEAALDKICGLLPPTIKDECLSFVDTYLPYVVDLILQELSPDQICQKLGVCTTAVNQVPLSQTPVKKGELCPLCQLVFTELYKILEKNSTKQQVEAALDKICGLLPPTIKDECLTFVDTYLPYVVDLILQELTPDQICQKLGVCTTAVNRVPLSQTPVKKGELCPLCQLVFTELYKILEKNSTKQQVEAALDKICGLLPPTIKDECLTFVDTYLPYVVDLILQELTPDQICQKLGVCTTAVNRVPLSQTPVKKGELCPLCQLVFTELYKILEKNSTKQQVEAALDKICGLLPPTIKDECLTFVDTYLPYVVDLILQELTPDQICQKLGVCTTAVNQAKLQALVAIQKAGSGPECVVCEYIVQYLDNIMDKNATEQQIEAALKKVCNVIPPALKTECDSFITKYTPELVQFLKTLTPQQVCTALKLCTSQASSQSLMFKSEMGAVGTVPPIKPYCSACKFALYELQSALDDPYMLNKSKALLYEFCSKLVVGKAECKTLVDANFQYLVLEIEGFNFPMELCQLITLCEPPPSDTMHNSEADCSLCKRFAMIVSYYVQQKKTVEEIKDLAPSTCYNVTPRTRINQCVAKIQGYTPELFQLISQNHDPTSACEAAAQCHRPPQGKLYKASSPYGAK